MLHDGRCPQYQSENLPNTLATGDAHLENLLGFDLIAPVDLNDELIGVLC
jgi:hypothetical protein